MKNNYSISKKEMGILLGFCQKFVCDFDNNLELHNINLGELKLATDISVSDLTHVLNSLVNEHKGKAMHLILSDENSRLLNGTITDLRNFNKLCDKFMKFRKISGDILKMFGK
ncbi:MAG: hypothetical protein NTZ97_04125 [Candidatus Moranbacteria bacterium]|nr:hypothetical protein [Candidatus Moranbacteria bacterium]